LPSVNVEIRKKQATASSYRIFSILLRLFADTGR
jgi:hypothetical protein